MGRGVWQATVHMVTVRHPEVTQHVQTPRLRYPGHI